MSATSNMPTLGTQPVISLPSTNTYQGGPGDYLDTGHNTALVLPSGTISVGFKLDGIQGKFALISKDTSGSNEGEFTVWIDDGEVKISIEIEGETHWVRVPDLELRADQEYHLAVSFGDDGLSVWLDGDLVLAEPELTLGIDGNTSSLVVGATRAWRDAEDEAHNMFRGEIGPVHIFDEQLTEADMIALANDVEPGLGADAAMADMMDALMPTFAQAHHGSATFQYILEDFGVSPHGHFMQPLAMQMGDMGDNTLTGTDEADGINGMGGSDAIDGLGGNDALQGGYGNDTLNGGDGNDILDGGHGNDVLNGGAGNDLLISTSDTREPYVGQALDPGETGMVYPDQPIPGNDVMTGGAGADIFYFQTQINAREEFLREHTQNDGTIRWHGVAGENNNVHDHWVDGIGDEVIMDYSREEGDRIVIEGHTTEIGSITYGDANGDGVMDHSVITLYSDQGNGGGAHDDDQLGTITVYGDLVTLADIEHTAGPAYGIITSIEDLEEALAPMDYGTPAGPVAPPPDLGTPADFETIGGTPPVMAVAGSFNFQPHLRAPLILDHSAGMNLTQGTIALTFTATNLWPKTMLFSKDASGYGDGGHITAYVQENGDLVVRLQTEDGSEYLTVQGAIEEGESYDMAVTFGPDGAELYLNGVRVAYIADSEFEMTNNDEAFVVGANNWSSTAGTTDSVWNHFDGWISNVVIYDQQLDVGDLPTTTPTNPPTPPAPGDPGAQAFGFALADCTFSTDASGQLIITHGSDTHVVPSDATSLVFTDATINVANLGNGSSSSEVVSGGGLADVVAGYAGEDTILGGAGDDTLNGGDDNDTLQGGAGADALNGGDGTDTADYSEATSAIRVDLANSALNLRYAAGDTYESIENVVGSFYSDNLRGDGADNTIWGGVNVDWIFGRGGNDMLYGEVGNDVLIGGAGADTLDGGENRDRAQYFNQVTVDLADASQNTGEAAGDVFISIEDLAGSKFNDRLFGDGGDNRLFGKAGNDLLVGRDGDDYLNGGLGADTLDGGAGNDTLRGGPAGDTFIFNAGDDVIEVFSAAQGDVLALDSSALGIDGMSAADIVATYADTSSGEVVFDFGNGNSLTLDGITTTDGLESTIEFV